MGYIKSALILIKLLDWVMAQIKKKGIENDFKNEIIQQGEDMVLLARTTRDTFSDLTSELRDADPNSRD